MYERRYRVMGLLRGKEVLLFTGVNKKYAEGLLRGKEVLLFSSGDKESAEKYCETFSTGDDGPIEIWIKEVFIKGETK